MQKSRSMPLRATFENNEHDTHPDFVLQGLNAIFAKKNRDTYQNIVYKRFCI